MKVSPVYVCRELNFVELLKGFFQDHPSVGNAPRLVYSQFVCHVLCSLNSISIVEGTIFCMLFVTHGRASQTPPLKQKSPKPKVIVWCQFLLKYVSFSCFIN